MKEYLKSKEEILDELKTDENNGLTEEEAIDRINKYGLNKLNDTKKDSVIKKFFKSLSNPMIILLLVAAGISFITSILSHDSFSDVIIILFVVILNTILEMIQENKAENSIEALKKMTKLTSKVIRNGLIKTVKSDELVIGDIIILEAGDQTPADCRIIESHTLKAEEAALTGESVPVNKIMDIINLKNNSLDIPLGDRTNMLYNGSSIVYGRGKAVVVATGMNTEIGKIASALQNAIDEKTPLQKKLSDISKFLTKVVIIISVIIFIVGLVKAGNITGEHLLNTFIFAVALSVAAIPEGLPAVVTIILSMGVTEMAKRKALIRKISAVETLGCTQIICTDKTGTLTQNKMTVVKNFSNNEHLMARALTLCNDASLEDGWAKGEPTESALVNYANFIGLSKNELEREYPRIGEAPFDSIRKMMTTVHKGIENGDIIQYTKGAVESLIEKSTHYIADNGEVRFLDDDARKEILDMNKNFADDALRVLGACYKKYDKEPDNYDVETLENDLIFVGFVGLIDPEREEVFDSIKSCKKAGIKVIMITGDHLDTAVAIGKKLGIINDFSEALEGSDIGKLEGEDLIDCLKTHSVFARVQPEHKTKIVKCLKSQNLVVAMTGDGVNDAPSIKEADIGISMGITGTEVTKSASDMILADDNFATIVNAVEEGRRIYDNIRKILQFQLSTNVAEVIYVFISSLLGVTIVTPGQLLWINMLTDSTPALALGVEKAEGDLMKRKPRQANESIFSNGAGSSIIIDGFIMAFIVLSAFFVGQNIEFGHIGLFESKQGVTMAFLVANFIEMFYAICMRSQRNSIFTMKHQNYWILGSVVVTILLTLVVIYVPFINVLFNLVPITAGEFLTGLFMAFSIVPLVEMHKIVKKIK